MSAVILEVSDLCVQRQGRPILERVQFQVRTGEILGVVGPNGAGKTTLVDAIAGEVLVTAGRVRFQGRDITGVAPHRLCRLGMGRTFQIARPFPTMTALENVMIGLWFGREGRRLLSSRESRHRALFLLEMVGMDHKAQTLGQELTLSEQRRLEVARAMATEPCLLMLDEIAAGLSPRAVTQAVELVHRLRDQGITLVIIDHFLNLTVRVSDRLLAMDRGRVLVEGRVESVLRHPVVRQAYLGEPLHKDRESEDESDEA